MPEMSPLTIALLVLVAAAVWAVVELALTLKKARAIVDEVGHSANDTIEQLQPIIAKADGLVDELQPTMKRVDPLVEQVDTTVGLLNESLDKVGGILGDVEKVSGVASNVTTAATNMGNAAGTAAATLVSKITGRKDSPAALESAEEAPAAESAPAPVASSGYVVYGTTTSAPSSSPELNVDLGSEVPVTDADDAATGDGE